MIFSSVKTLRVQLELTIFSACSQQLTFEQHPPKMSPTVLSDARMISAMTECARLCVTDC